jgi:CRP-like cAMP-binding protein
VRALRTSSSDVWHLKRIDWLEQLGEDEWRRLRGRSSRHVFANRATIFTPVPDPRSVYLLETGAVRIYRISADGDEVSLGYVAPGEVFGELAGFGEYPRESFAVAAAASVVWRIPVEIFRGLLSSRPELVLVVTRQIGDRMKRVESRVESLVFRSIRARLAIVLLELADDFARSEGEALVFDAVFTQQDLATLVGATRQSVNGALGELRADGCLRMDGRRFRIEDPKRLHRLGHESAAP